MDLGLTPTILTTTQNKPEGTAHNEWSFFYLNNAPERAPKRTTKMTNELTLNEVTTLLNSIPNISVEGIEDDNYADVQDDAMRDYRIEYTVSVEDGKAIFYGSDECSWSNRHVVEYSAEATRDELLEAVEVGHLAKLDWSFDIGS